jgi:hypothetical protein
MLIDRPLRAACILLCVVLLQLPTRMYFHTPTEWSVMGVLRSAFNLWLLAFGYLCAMEGRDQERERQRRARAQKEQGD